MLHAANVLHACCGPVLHPCSLLPGVCCPPHPWVPARVQLKAAPCPHARLSPLAPSPPAPHGFPGPPRAGLGGLWPPSGGHKGTGGGPGAPADPQLPGPTAILGMYTLMSNKQYYDAICSGTISNTEGINSE